MLYPKDVPYRNVRPRPYPAAIRPRRIRQRRRPSPNRVSKALCLLEHEISLENLLRKIKNNETVEVNKAGFAEMPFS